MIGLLIRKITPPTPLTMTEDQRKHLEFVQAIITRMAGNSFLIKGWAITIVAALNAISGKDGNISYGAVALACIPFFCWFDAYYLCLEKQFRYLYNHLLDNTAQLGNFKMPVTDENKKVNNWVEAFKSPSVWMLYSALLIGTGVMLVIIITKPI